MNKKPRINSTEKNPDIRIALPFEYHRFWSKSIALLTHGLLWLVVIFGIFVMPALMSFGSKKSYYGEKFDRDQWMIFFVILLVYNTLASIYLGLPASKKKYQIVGLINLILLILFIAASFINSFFIFY